MDISQIAKIAAQQANLHFINNSSTAPTNDEWNYAFAQFVLAAIPKEPVGVMRETDVHWFSQHVPAGSLIYANFPAIVHHESPLVDAMRMELQRLSGMYQRATGYAEPSSVTRVLSCSTMKGVTHEG